MSEAKRFTRIVTDAAGGSVFQDDEFPLGAPPGVTGMLTGTVPAASAVVYVRHDVFDFPPVPRPALRRQWVYVHQELSACAGCPAVTVMLDAGGAGTYTQRAIPGHEPDQPP